MRSYTIYRTYIAFFLVLFYCFVFQACKNRHRVKYIKIEQGQTIDKDSDQANNWLIFDYFEDYASIRSKKALRETFGAKNCVDGKSTYANGAIKVKHTIIFNTQNNHIVKYVWNKKDPKKLDFIEASHIIYDNKHHVIGNQNIESECGMSLGMPLVDLVNWNRSQFDFIGFGGASQGIVQAPDFSKLDQCQVKVVLGYDEKMDTDKYLSLFGEHLIESSDELVKKAPIFVSTFTMYIHR